jgi:hypothetical protein
MKIWTSSTVRRFWLLEPVSNLFVCLDNWNLQCKSSDPLEALKTTFCVIPTKFQVNVSALDKQWQRSFGWHSSRVSSNGSHSKPRQIIHIPQQYPHRASQTHPSPSTVSWNAVLMLRIFESSLALNTSPIYTPESISHFANDFYLINSHNVCYCI